MPRDYSPKLTGVRGYHNGTIKIAPAAIHFDICLGNVPTLSDPAPSPQPKGAYQRRGKLGFPITDRLVAELDPPDQEHFRQIAQTQLVSESSEDYERDDVGWVLSAVQDSAAALIELLSTNAAPEAPVTLSRPIWPFGNLLRGALDAPHFPFLLSGGSYAGGLLPSQSILARRMTEPTEQLKDASLSLARQSGWPVQYLTSAASNKEDIVRRIAAADHIDEGLICVLTAVEPCWSFEIVRDRTSRRIEAGTRYRKCLPSTTIRSVRGSAS